MASELVEREPMSNEERLREALKKSLPASVRKYIRDDVADVEIAMWEWVNQYTDAACDLLLTVAKTLLASTEPEQPASEGEDCQHERFITITHAGGQEKQCSECGVLVKPSTTEEQPTAPGKKWTPAALEEWTPEQWADALDAARTDLMCAEDFEPSDVAHVMNICAQVLRRPQEQGEPEDLARRFHEAYERLAPEHGYKTREESAVPWKDVPANNRALMIATVKAVFCEPAAGGEDE